MENRPPWMPIAIYYSGKGKILPIPPIPKSIYPGYLKKIPKKSEPSISEFKDNAEVSQYIDPALSSQSNEQ